jgi:hypothetical protein
VFGSASWKLTSWERGPNRSVSPHDDPVEPANNLTLASTDRLRLEVAVAGNREIQSWPGASSFDSRPIDQIIGSGPTSTGSFGTYLIEVFDNPGADIEFTREQTFNNQRVFEYRFHIPLKSSHYRVKVDDGWQNTASSGSFGIVAATADLTRFTIRTDRLPAVAQMCQASTTIDYHEIRIGNGDFLIPLQSEFQTAQIDATRTRSVSRFSGCREYTADSTLSFDEAIPGTAKANEVHAAAAALPAGLALALKLTAPIDTRTASAGDVVTATVSKAVTVPGSNRILIPAGSRVKGRISEMRQFMKPAARFQIGLAFDTVAFEGIETPVALALVVEQNPLVSPGGSRERSFGSSLRSRPVDLNIPPPNNRGTGGTLVFRTDKTSWIVPTGYESKWITREHKP